MKRNGQNKSTKWLGIQIQFMMKKLEKYKVADNIFVVTQIINNSILKLPPCPGQAQPAVDHSHGGGAAAAQDHHLPLPG